MCNDVRVTHTMAALEALSERIRTSYIGQPLLRDLEQIKPDDIRVGMRAICPRCECKFIAPEPQGPHRCEYCDHLFAAGQLAECTDKSVVLITFSSELTRQLQPQRGV